MKLVDCVVQNCEEIFTMGDLITKVPVFSFVNALRVLEVVQEIFMDIPYFDETVLHLTSQGVCLDNFSFPHSCSLIDLNDSTIYGEEFDIYNQLETVI